MKTRGGDGGEGGGGGVQIDLLGKNTFKKKIPPDLLGLKYQI